MSPTYYSVNRWTRYADGWRGGSSTSGIRTEERARMLFAEQKDRGCEVWAAAMPFLEHGEPVSWGVILWAEGGAVPLDLFGHSAASEVPTTR